MADRKVSRGFLRGSEARGVFGRAILAVQATHSPFLPVATPRVLVVDDERKVREAVAEGLRIEEWQVAVAATGAEALSLLTGDSFDLVVLDWMLPDLDGVEVLEQARARGVAAPVLMVTARSAVDDRLEGFDRGVDDYLVKPFAFAELLARSRALLRRYPATGARLACADLELDARARAARRGAHEIPLTPIELDVLEYLMRRKEHVVTREMLARDVWRVPTYDAALRNAINIHVARLRQKIEDTGQPLIHTIHGVGYRMSALPEMATAAGR